MTATVRRIGLIRRHIPCPVCAALSKRHSTARRRLHEIGTRGPTVLVITYSKHYCERCRKYFNVDMAHLAPAGGHFTHRVRRAAVDLARRAGGTLSRASEAMRRRYHVRVPASTIHDWLQAERYSDTDFYGSSSEFPDLGNAYFE